jgi:uncharacterized protein (DUF2235 family)
MTKNIIICGDGTSKTYRGSLTNVARMFAALEREDPQNQVTQVATYYPGVGTLPDRRGSDKIMRLASQAFGYGVQRTVMEMYSFLSESYQPGDRIYLFGFSRGAFTVRVLAGLVHRCGILRPGNGHMIPYAFELYRPHYEELSSRKRQKLKREVADFRLVFSRPEAPIEFLGIWDTVKSLGYLWPISLPHTRRNSIVKCVRHAMSLHERRVFFGPSTWGGLDADGAETVTGRDIKEVWFVGNHSDVGGGASEDERGLADISLRWMCREAANAGVRFNERHLREALSGDACGRYTENAAFYATHPSLTWAWRLAYVAPRLEITNEHGRTKRVFKWGTGGRRRHETFVRNKMLAVHGSAQEPPLNKSYHELKIDKNIVMFEPDLPMQPDLDCDGPV